MPRATPDTNLIGRRTVCFELVDSTNTLAAQYADDPANDGLVIVSEEQRAGRGRHGRTWLSPPGQGLLLSVLIFPPDNLRRPALLTGLAAVAMCETIYDCTKLHATIKWPNDVLIRGRKVCGILVEQGKGVVIGIGLNVLTPESAFAEAGLTEAASLAMFANTELSRRHVMETLLRQLDDRYHDLLQGRDGDLEARWRCHLGLLGKQVTLVSQGDACQGHVVELAFEGVLLQPPDGPLTCFAPESVERITPVD